MSNRSGTSHRDILKSAAIVGGASVVSILVSILRAKFTAVYLGTYGVGLMGTYSSITGLIATAAGLGIGNSGVRQIAEAAGTQDERRIARTIVTIRRVTFALGLAGTGLMVLLAQPLSKWTFGDTSHAPAVSLLAITILFGAVSGGQTALVQGVLRIADLARISILGAVLGACVSIPMMVTWGQRSIIPILLATSGMGILTSWYYARRIVVPDVAMTWGDTWREARPLMKLGLAFVSSGLMISGVAYLTRAILVRQLGLEEAGLYGAAWSLSSLYVGFVLGAMGTDFFPRLTAAAHDNSRVNRLVNEQTEVSLLLAMPGLVATLTFAPWVLHVFYSAAFVPAGELLRWQTLGLVLRVLSWPMGFILLAKGNGRAYFLSELAAHSVHLGLIWVCVSYWGLSGAGVAFVGLYAFYVALILVMTGNLTGFVWSADVRSLMGLICLVSLLGFLVGRGLPPTWSALIGAVLAGGSGAYSLRRLTVLTGINPAAVLVSRAQAICGLRGGQQN